MKLKDIIKEFLETKNNYTFCTCGYRQSHNLIWCSKCGKNFKISGYTPSTIGEKIKWLYDKKNGREKPKYCAAIILRECRKKTNNKNLSINKIENEIITQLNL